MDKWDGKLKWWQEKDWEFPSPTAHDEQGVDASNRSRGWGAKCSRTHAHSQSDNTASTQHVFQCELQHQELEVVKELR